MVRFEYLNKNHFEKYASGLFDILSDNMSIIAPTGNSKEEDFKSWICVVGKGIKKDNRHIVLIIENKTNNLVGFFQYYTTIDTFMMEEIQFCSDFQGKYNIFRDLYSFVLNNIGVNLIYVEAYANKLNNKSIGILERLGLKIIGENKSGRAFHFKGYFDDFMKWYLDVN